MKKNLFIISESERGRILGMHKEATKRSYISEQATTTPAATTPAATTPAATTTVTKGPSNSVKLPNLTNENFCSLPKDKIWKYALMDDGTWYASKDQINWFRLTIPKYQKAIDILRKDASCSVLEPVASLSTKPSTAVTPQVATDQSKTLAVSGGGGETPKLADPVGDAKKIMPKIDTLDPVKMREVMAWSNTPSGQYVLKTPADQREVALDNLDRRKGDPKTRELKREIRQALGMAADTLVGKVASSVRGGVQGLKQGFQQQTTK
jgi:hypothetical protein